MEQDGEDRKDKLDAARNVVKEPKSETQELQAQIKDLCNGRQDCIASAPSRSYNGCVQALEYLCEVMSI